jgi:hypothetical protein
VYDIVAGVSAARWRHAALSEYLNISNFYFSIFLRLVFVSDFHSGEVQQLQTAESQSDGQ